MDWLMVEYWVDWMAVHWAAKVQRTENWSVDYWGDHWAAMMADLWVLMAR